MKLLLLVIVLFLFNPIVESQQPTYLSHACLNATTFAINSTYQANRDALLSSLSSNGTRASGFHNTTAGRSPDMVYGLFLCRGDLSTSVCRACVTFATTDISQRCPVDATAVVWYEECLLRYSDRNIFSVVTEAPTFLTYNSTQNVTQPERFKMLAGFMMNETARAANEITGGKKFATGEVFISALQKLYALAQCTPDLSVTDCDRCLESAIGYLPTGRLGGRFLNPSCNIRFEFYPFYNLTSAVAAPEETKQNKSNRIPVLFASLSAIFGLVLVSAFGFLLWRLRNNQGKENSEEIQLLDLVNEHTGESFSGENVGKSQEFPFFRLDTLHAATNHFSDDNKLGQGGFGPVYKGTLANGKEIAVKRLSRTSGQGLVEFKNEIVLIARLQHRNLVKLLGCCLEKNEKLLVYEFMPNGSLDVFLFDSSSAAQLDWQKRFSIIKGIARGILYLHEDSRLKIIHRDLKASNVLLDRNMNPKISDFGMARIFSEDKNEAITNRVVGTYGYMPPEYAMRGLFSIKSDVFSFGALLLEVVTGKKNNSYYFFENGESLLTSAWKLWSKGKGMDLIDQLLVPSCVASEVLKCIHIGLLCVQGDPADRPTMSSVVVMLASDTVPLPRPAEPTFPALRAIAEPAEPTSNDGVFSINEVTISNILPR
ncbi:cysteine-rich RLK (RECEPTOR-like protein kinase) 10 [Hibiscus trionum]|uniref:non-specific serine/threonine protein kinase n=1 Tax=Hibiscus trionum TaxID=183268 RepID=A0A9W7LVL0_HIBTR|nr:cysteine-rich RLK (RECEPTOR-like protein kinase) 10 [Hibiscus trionum]